MGTCFSKKKDSSSYTVASKGGVAVSSSTPIGTAVEETSNSKPNSEIRETNLKPLKKDNTKETLHLEKQEQSEEGEVIHNKKKQIFVIKHRRSHDGREKESKQVMDHELVCTTTTSAHPSIEEATSAADELLENKNNKAPAVPTPSIGLGVTTSSCTEEELEAILIQCGRLSRSSSGKAASSSDDIRGRRYSGSKRSYDFDQRDNDGVVANESKISDNSADYDGNGGLIEKRHQHRQRTRNSSRGASPSSTHGRRRTPSRERDQQRSSSRERRVSRSPGRRSSEPNSCNITRNYCEGTNRPSKMVSVPATVSSLVMDKSNNGGNENAIKRISVKRNVGDPAIMAGSRSAASPRAQSPIRAKSCNEGGTGQQQPSLSRSSSRKAEQSPCRRNPLSEIDPNSLQYPQSQNNKCKRDIDVEEIFVKEVSNAQKQRPNVETGNNKGGGRTTSRSRVDTKNMNTNSTIKDQRQHQQVSLDEAKTIRISGAPHTLSRSRSLRCSRDLDEINPETLLNPTPSSYTRLLLDDIQNFHQKKTTNNNTNIINTNTVVAVPQCVSKACSILEAVADLNSTTSSNLSEQSNRRYGYTSLLVSNKNLSDSKDPFVESEVIANDDLMEPSFHKYVTVRRGGGSTGGGADAEDQESSGSNSYVQQQNWGNSSSSWEPNSADSINDGCWTSKSHTNPTETERKCVVDHHKNSGRPSIGRGRSGATTLHSVSFGATT